MAGQCCNLVRCASRFRESTRGGLAQAMEDAVTRQAGLIAPGAKLLTEGGDTVTPAGPGGQQREVADCRRGGNDLLQFGMHRNSERDSRGVPGLLRPHREYAVADVLAADAHHVGSPLRREDAECKRQPRLGANA